jgi:hypothetical protein
MPRLYRYVGPEGIRAGACRSNARCAVSSPGDILAWLRRSDQLADPRGLFAATYVVDAASTLVLADRRSEHVACARGDYVLSAGEIFFSRFADQRRIDVIEVNNLSTGYCPEAESWPAVAAALERIGLRHPGGFTQSFVFRQCPACGQRNVVKDGWFLCAACAAPLPEAWNFGPDSAR